MQRGDLRPALETSLVPARNKDLANVVLNNDAVHSADLAAETLGLVVGIVQVRADGDFKWSTGDDPDQAKGPWLDGGQLWHIPVGGATALKLIRKTNGGATVNVYLKALGAN